MHVTIFFMKTYKINSFVLNLIYTFVVHPLYESLYVLLTGPSAGHIMNLKAKNTRWMEVLFFNFKPACSKNTHMQNTIQTKPRVYLFNHRSWADMFIDYVICGGCAFVSNPNVWLLVIFLLPPLYIYDVVIALFGVKGRPGASQRLHKILTTYRAKHPHTNIGVYPEGSRHQGTDSLPLKMSIVDWCFYQKEDTQIIITSHKEDVINEFQRTSFAGANLFISRSRVLEPGSFANIESWRATVVSSWHETWQRAYHPRVPAMSGEGSWEVMSFPDIPSNFAPDTHACSPVEQKERYWKWYKCLFSCGIFTALCCWLVLNFGQRFII